MIQIHGTKIQISQEGIVSAWDQYYVESEGGVDDVPTKRNSVGGSGVLDLVEISSSQAEEGRQHVVTAKYEGLAAERRWRPGSVTQWQGVSHTPCRTWRWVRSQPHIRDRSSGSKPLASYSGGRSVGEHVPARDR